MLVAIHLMRHGRNDKVLFHGLPQELRDDLDLLTPSLEVGQWDPGHPGHLHVVDNAHQLVQQPIVGTFTKSTDIKFYRSIKNKLQIVTFLCVATKNKTKKLYYFRNINETNFSPQKRLRIPDWEISIFETVDGQTSTGLRVSVLEIGDDAVVNILLLLLKTYFARVGSTTGKGRD